mmetsp:Transcript_71154/g.87283  ORF Transcript_71154/g.87283 Transcript_71154/m.87283 type:complete len:103 (-) Transcript_71154:166-474(-)
MQVTIKVSRSGDTYKINIKSNEKISSIKAKIASKTGIKSDDQMLICCGKPLVYDSNTASQYNIKSNAVIMVSSKKQLASYVRPDLFFDHNIIASFMTQKTGK